MKTQRVKEVKQCTQCCTVAEGLAGIWLQIQLHHVFPFPMMSPDSSGPGTRLYSLSVAPVWDLGTMNTVGSGIVSSLRSVQ